MPAFFFFILFFFIENTKDWINHQEKMIWGKKRVKKRTKVRIWNDLSVKSALCGVTNDDSQLLGERLSTEGLTVLFSGHPLSFREWWLTHAKLHWWSKHLKTGKIWQLITYADVVKKTKQTPFKQFLVLFLLFLTTVDCLPANYGWNSLAAMPRPFAWCTSMLWFWLKS